MYLFLFYFLYMYLYAKSENPDHTSRSLASDLGLHYLPVSIFTGHYEQVGHEAIILPS